jgi:hypothetical protein
MLVIISSLDKHVWRDQKVGVGVIPFAAARRVYTPAMPLDRSLRATFRNFLTVFFVVAIVSVPLHVGHGFVYRKVMNVRELHPDIEDFPERRKVRRVSAKNLDESRNAFLFVTVLEVVLLPLAVGATRRVLDVDGRGGVPGVLDAWAHSIRAWHRPVPDPGNSLAVVVGAVLGLIVGYLLERIGLLLAEPVPGSVAFAPIGLVQGMARAAGAVFLLVPLAQLGRVAKGRESPAPTL